MPSPLSARSLVTRVSRRVNDLAELTWTAAVILEAADDALRFLWDTVKASGNDTELDRIDTSVADMTLIENGWYEYALPEYVGSIRKIEGVSNPGSIPYEFPTGPLEMKEIGRSTFGSGMPVWIPSRWGRPGSISFYGAVQKFPTIRIWYIRHWPPMHYGTAQAQLGTPSASRLVFASAPVGRVINRLGLYAGMDVEISADSTAGNVDQVRRITGDLTDSGQTKMTFATPWSGVPGSSTQYSLVVPMNPEHAELLVESIARRLFERSGNELGMAMQAERLGMLEQRFRAGLRRPHVGNFPRIWNTRG